MFVSNIVIKVKKIRVHLFAGLVAMHYICTITKIILTEATTMKNTN